MASSLSPGIAESLLWEMPDGYGDGKLRHLCDLTIWTGAPGLIGVAVDAIALPPRVALRAGVTDETSVRLRPRRGRRAGRPGGLCEGDVVLPIARPS
ncbi:hypothetical protein [Sinorhizobium fredii]|uniref:hypothetical protein n=1 Tax=Rhizobium fredii TaxID=380 RepID=UPI0004B7D4C5|nr:hypothetical protein AOX55_00006375 [Sinorhizobium fredii CCBAU 25509]MCG5473845.1 hypothetical protein [Sinorhizobium fredii]